MKYFLSIIAHPFRKRVYIKPHGDHWIVEKLTLTESWFDDAMYYGFRVACHNLWHELTTPPTPKP